jgi:hypothetical protein
VVIAPVGRVLPSVQAGGLSIDLAFTAVFIIVLVLWAAAGLVVSGGGGLTGMDIGCSIADCERCCRSGPAVRGGSAPGGERTVSRAVNPVSR